MYLQILSLRIAIPQSAVYVEETVELFLVAELSLKAQTCAKI